MTTILKPGIEKILQVLYKKHQRFHLRSLARETNQYGQSITRYLKELEKEKILESKKEGNLKQFQLKNNKKVFAIKALFDIERFEKLPFEKKEAISSYIKTLPEKPVFIILFGSTAKGTFTKESDIDLLIITNKKIQTTEAEKEADALHATKISTFQINYKDCLKELKLKDDKVIQSAISTGYPILNQIYYYEVIQNERI